MCALIQVKEICNHDDSLNEYTNLFAQGYKSVDQVEAEFAEAFGESFQYLDPVRVHTNPSVPKTPTTACFGCVLTSFMARTLPNPPHFADNGRVDAPGGNQ